MIIIIVHILGRFIYCALFLLFMVHLMEMMEYLKRYPVFDDTVVMNRLGKSIEYTHLYIHRLSRRGLIHRIERNRYTVFNDPFLIASRLVWPSYISCWSALKYHNLTEQVPHSITVVATIDKKDILFNNTEIRFVRTSPKNCFGYEKVNYGGFEIFVADTEKSIIDSALLRKVSFSEINDIVSGSLNNIKTGRFLEYLIRIGNRSLINRFGYVFSALGKDYYNKLKNHIQATYVRLDYSKKLAGERDKRWRLVINA